MKKQKQDNFLLFFIYKAGHKELVHQFLKTRMDLELSESLEKLHIVLRL